MSIKNDFFSWAGFSIVIIVYIALVCANIVSVGPSADESFVAIPAHNLIHYGFAGTTTWVEQGSAWQGINRRTYNTLPLGILYLSAWFALFPSKILVARAAFALWGFGMLYAFFRFLRALTGDRPVAMLAVALFALDYYFIIGTSQCRVDVMTGALGMTALAVYAELRVLHLKRAILFSFMLVTLAAATHPEGVLYLAALSVLAFYSDFRALTKAHFVLAATPIATGLALWMLYVAQDWTAAMGQLIENSIHQNRFPDLLHPIHLLKREWVERYLQQFGFSGPSIQATGLKVLKRVPLVLLASGVLCAVLMPAIRKLKGTRAIMLLAATVFVCMTVLENGKFGFYLVHILPFYYALVAVSSLYTWRAGALPRIASAIGVTGLLAFNAGGAAERARLDHYGREFGPAVSFLRNQSSTQDLVIGDSALWFDYGQDHNLKDEVTLGVKSGLIADYIVENQGYRNGFLYYKAKDPVLFAAMQTHLAEYDLVYDRGGWQIYHRH